MKLIFKIFSLSLLWCLFSCHNNTKVEKSNYSSHMDSMTIAEFNNDNSVIDSLLCLSPSGAKTDSFELKLFIEPSMITPASVEFFAIKRQSENWMGEHFLCFYHVHYYPDENAYFVPKPVKSGHRIFKLDSLIMKIVTPKCGWHNFIDSLKVGGLFELSSQSDSINRSINDGTGYYVEYSTKENYKLFWYHSPGYINQKDNIKFAKILRMWDRNFRIYNWEGYRTFSN